jgi:hypothetical protein
MTQREADIKANAECMEYVSITYLGRYIDKSGRRTRGFLEWKVVAILEGEVGLYNHGYCLHSKRIPNCCLHPAYLHT